eukprot:TRINITY_DN12328_c0_g1_i3.p2 TRINITY_DN12328_c0_g1~~TRINITY_DN12328_c0_g1_i3.p2  ORF type:complete len:127 (+),score=16.16 TRINITY_DN12328_c0_g1_i3:848-1228(+)
MTAAVQRPTNVQKQEPPKVVRSRVLAATSTRGSVAVAACRPSVPVRVRDPPRADPLETDPGAVQKSPKPVSRISVAAHADPVTLPAAAFTPPPSRRLPAVPSQQAIALHRLRTADRVRAEATLNLR